jgi:hypothetical protein
MDGKRTGKPTIHAVSLGLQLTASAILLIVAGCSTAPVADFLDLVHPGRFPAKAKDPHGGVCVPQGGPAGGVLGGPPPGVTPNPPTPPGPGELPPPLPPPVGVPPPK